MSHYDNARKWVEENGVALAEKPVEGLKCYLHVMYQDEDGHHECFSDSESESYAIVVGSTLRYAFFDQDTHELVRSVTEEKPGPFTPQENEVLAIQHHEYLYLYPQFENEEQFIEYVGVYETSWDIQDILTVKQYEDLQQSRKEEEERQKRMELQNWCQNFMKKNDIKQLDSLEMLEALHEYFKTEKERLEDYRYGMREDGLCIGWGVTPSQWLDEHNASIEDSHRVANHAHEIWNWLEETVPMLMVEWRAKEKAIA